MNKPKVYIAGALNSDAVYYIQNMHKMACYAEEIRKMGYSVYVPFLDILMGFKFGNYEYYDYFENSQPWLASSDIMFVVPGYENSYGAKKEIEFAKSLETVMIVFSLEEMREMYAVFKAKEREKEEKS